MNRRKIAGEKEKLLIFDYEVFSREFSLKMLMENEAEVEESFCFQTLYWF